MNRVPAALAFLALSALCTSCMKKQAEASNAAPQVATVGITTVKRRPIAQNLTVSSELVPFQEIDVYAKEAGYVKQLLVDYGTHVKRGQLMAVLEIPELEAQLQQDRAAIDAQKDIASQSEHEVTRRKAQHTVVHLQYERIAGVAKKQPGMVAQQEVDDAQGRDLEAEAQVEAAQVAVRAAQSQFAAVQAKLTRDQALYDYSKIAAPFEGVVTKRYANLGALMQAGTSSTQATPLVRLSQENLYRLVIPVPEAYVKYIKVGNAVDVKVASLNRTFAGKVTRLAVDVNSETRTMHTEVDVPNRNQLLVPGLYAEAVLTFNQRPDALTVPLEAVDRQGDHASVMVVDGAGHLENRSIALGIQTANYAEVEIGLEPGDQVVVSDRSGLKVGQAVHTRAVSTMAYEGQQGSQP